MDITLHIIILYYAVPYIEVLYVELFKASVTQLMYASVLKMHKTCGQRQHG